MLDAARPTSAIAHSATKVSSSPPAMPPGRFSTALIVPSSATVAAPAATPVTAEKASQGRKGFRSPETSPALPGAGPGGSPAGVPGAVFISAVFQPPAQRRGGRVRSSPVDDPAAGLFMVAPRKGGADDGHP